MDRKQEIAAQDKRVTDIQANHLIQRPQKALTDLEGVLGKQLQYMT